MRNVKILFTGEFEGQTWEMRTGEGGVGKSGTFATHVNCDMKVNDDDKHSERWSWIIEDNMDDLPDQTEYWCHYCRSPVPKEIQAMLLLYWSSTE